LQLHFSTRLVGGCCSPVVCACVWGDLGDGRVPCNRLPCFDCISTRPRPLRALPHPRLAQRARLRLGCLSARSLSHCPHATPFSRCCSHRTLAFKMGRTHGIRRGTRDMFAVDYKKHGMAQQALQRYFVNYKVGDIVDIKVRRVGVWLPPPRHTRPLASSPHAGPCHTTPRPSARLAVCPFTSCSAAVCCLPSVGTVRMCLMLVLPWPCVTDCALFLLPPHSSLHC